MEEKNKSVDADIETIVAQLLVSQERERVRWGYAVFALGHRSISLPQSEHMLSELPALSLQAA